MMSNRQREKKADEALWRNNEQNWGINTFFHAAALIRLMLFALRTERDRKKVAELVVCDSTAQWKGDSWRKSGRQSRCIFHVMCLRGCQVSFTCRRSCPPPEQVSHEKRPNASLPLICKATEIIRSDGTKRTGAAAHRALTPAWRRRFYFITSNRIFSIRAS